MSTRVRVLFVVFVFALTVALGAPVTSYAAPGSGKATVALVSTSVPGVVVPSRPAPTKQLPRVLASPSDFQAATDAVTFAAYGNYVRLWGIVAEIYHDGSYHTDSNGARVWDVLPTWMAFIMTGADFTPQRWECGFHSFEPTPEELACTEVLEGDSILLNAHLASRSTGDFDGPSSFPSANGIYRCQGTTPQSLTGPCVLLTE